jgi:hypothetical protein
MQSDTIYLGVTLAALASAVLLILTVSRRNVLVFAPVILIPPAWWAMIQWRCKISGGYDCGHAFSGGISWHFWAALAILAISFASLAVVFSWRQQTRPLQELGNLLLASRALAGLWAYILWAELPIPVSHPPSHGGTCPKIPLVCHDMPLGGFGGGLWWTGPFVASAALGIARYTFSAWHKRRGRVPSREAKMGDYHV